MFDKGPIVILGAMDGEIESFLNTFEIVGKQKWQDFTFYPGKLENRDILIARSGVGKILTAMVTQKIIDLFHPSAIIFTGIAGSINPELNIGDMLIGRDSVQHDFNATKFNFKLGEIPYTPYRFFKSDDFLYNKAMTFSSEKYKVIGGRILTGDQFISDKTSSMNSYLTDELHGDCVEMEGAAAALVANVNQIPHLIIRTISDKADGKDKINFRSLLKIASENSLKIVQHILNNI